MADDRPPGSRNDPDTRKGSVLLSGLMLTPDDALEVFRERRAGDPALDTAHLKRARDILDALQLAIGGKDPERWQRVEQAWLALCSKPSWMARPAARAPAPEAPATPAPPPAEEKKPASNRAPDDEPVKDAQPPPVGSLQNPAAPPLPLPPVKSPWTSPVAAAAQAFPPSPLPNPPPQAGEGVSQVTDLDRLIAQNPSLAAFAKMVAPEGQETGTMIARGSPPAGPALPFHSDEPSPAQVNPFTRAGETESAEPPPRKRHDTAPPPSEPPPSTPWSQPDTSVHTSAAGPALPFKPVDADPEATVARGVDLAAAEQEWRNAEKEKTGPPPLAAHLAALDVEAYAALSAQCAVWPEWIAQIHARYGIRSEAERADLDAHWSARLAADAALGEAFRWHRQRHEEWERQRLR